MTETAEFDQETCLAPEDRVAQGQLDEVKRIIGELGT